MRGSHLGGASGSDRGVSLPGWARLFANRLQGGSARHRGGVALGGSCFTGGCCRHGRAIVVRTGTGVRRGCAEEAAAGECAARPIERFLASDAIRGSEVTVLAELTVDHGSSVARVARWPVFGRFGMALSITGE